MSSDTTANENQKRSRKRKQADNTTGEPKEVKEHSEMKRAMKSGDQHYHVKNMQTKSTLKESLQVEENGGDEPEEAEEEEEHKAPTFCHSSSSSSSAAKSSALDWPVIDCRLLPAWLRRSSLGVLVHLGIYSVTAFHRHPVSKRSGGLDNGSEWYLRRLCNPFLYRRETRDYHQSTYGDRSYYDIAKDFHCSKLNADSWIAFLSACGVNYFLLTARHHDGFCLWDTDFPSRLIDGKPFSSAHLGANRDLLQEFAQACKKYNIVFGIYYSLLEWNQPSYNSDKQKGTQNYVDSIVIPQLKEIIQKYRPQVLWMDGGWERQSKDWRALELLSFYYSLVPTGLTNDRWGKDCVSIHGQLITNGDRTLAPPKRAEQCAQLVLPIERGWAYNRQSRIFKDKAELLGWWRKCKALGGNLLLGLAPTGDGELVEEEKKVLVDLGAAIRAEEGVPVQKQGKSQTSS